MNRRSVLRSDLILSRWSGIFFESRIRFSWRVNLQTGFFSRGSDPGQVQSDSQPWGKVYVRPQTSPSLSPIAALPYTATNGYLPNEHEECLLIANIALMNRKQCPVYMNGRVYSGDVTSDCFPSRQTWFYAWIKYFTIERGSWFRSAFVSQGQGCGSEWLGRLWIRFLIKLGSGFQLGRICRYKL